MTGKKLLFFPGGYVDFGESAKKALVRETKEELGLKINNKQNDLSVL
ncbi:MAG: hypothetical protein CO145_01010 [Candidatus Nealsonbacteria bacterium CG_4_9_14_3_um_filter_37_13]|uniref:Nudix hydrolase domain-containing protein n=2 Tax=Candidatus Nealsoniibacteriota TaxID=1817911 RepID=A0A2H0TJ51_9BACT|nr:MAG: hypothetical protein COU43_02080 [Candidatus Nealsonbacteria bacterium CG10_big_fil_rev_8_21_14_0_10_37_25]PJA84584.1 MAG: hypothetical protein CO145_01010 [Candidatus Nealsonbacteria bacterium CG_4_9_14_3_um_filter_37_13]